MILSATAHLLEWYYELQYCEEKKEDVKLTMYEQIVYLLVNHRKYEEKFFQYYRMSVSSFYELLKLDAFIAIYEIIVAYPILYVKGFGV